jgi:protein O-GlcNAc transferase
MNEPQRKAPSPTSASSGSTTLREALALHQAGQLLEAEQRYRDVLRNQPENFDSLHLLGVISYHRGDYGEAITRIDAALAINPDAAIAHNNRGAALKELKRHEAALASYDRAIALKPGYAEAHNNRGVALNALKRFEEGLASCEQAIALRPGFAEAFYNRGNALSALKRFEAALADYQRAIELKADYPEAFSRRAAVLAALNRLPEAVASYDKAIALKPDLKYLAGDRLSAKMSSCDWSTYQEDWSRIVVDLAKGSLVAPFHLLATPIGPADQLTCAKRLIAEEFPESDPPLWRGERYTHDRIRIGYLSADFREHPVSYLAAGLFEQHDRSRFEVVGVAFGPDDQGEMRSRLRRGFDRFIDVDRLDDQAAANLLRELEIDIAIDLMGLTHNTRLGVFALRPAPIQVSYLGYAGTTGAGYIDYVVADHFLVPPEQSKHLSERVVRLPESFQVNDDQRRISDSISSRQQAGLPDNGFVFCCFNNHAKISPAIFDIWMRLLRQIDGSVLWLASAEPSTRGNLAGEAAKRGVSPERLIFAPKLDRQADHLARLRVADLFLDTLYFNAHTTASDALWAGMPVLTCSGATMASRVAGSLLTALGLPELISFSVEDYEALALKLAVDPEALSSIRQKLARNRDACPLFDTARFARHLEAAYGTMWERCQRGDPPESFDVAPIAVNAR